jgi:hypothetical protein
MERGGDRVGAEYCIRSRKRLNRSGILGAEGDGAGAGGDGAGEWSRSGILY